MNKIEKADYIFKRSSNGSEDFLQKAISIDAQAKEILFQSIGPSQGVHFMNYLHKHYVDNEIVELLYSIDTNESNIIQKLMKIFKSMPTTFVHKDFRKVNNNFTALYDEFHRLKLADDEFWLKAERRRLSNLTINNPDYIPDGII